MKNKHLVHKRVMKPVFGGFIKSKQLTHARTHLDYVDEEAKVWDTQTNKQTSEIVLEISVRVQYNVALYTFIFGVSQPASQPTFQRD